MKKCHNRERREDRGFKLEELEKIKQALREKSSQVLTQRINEIKQMFNLN